MTSGVNERLAWQAKSFDKPLVVASHFGFVPIETPRLRDEDTELADDYGTDPHYNVAEKAAFLSTYLEHDLASLPHPLGVSYKRNKNHALELVGWNAGLGEALLIRAALSILTESGHKHLSVDINCIGDKDSIGTYQRELQTYLARSGTSLPADMKKELKKDVFSLVRASHPDLAELRESAPTSIAFLSTESRNYFKEVLEYIEALDIEFRLAPHLVGDKNYCSHTIFNIKNTEEDAEEVLAVGYCYPRLGKKVGIKKETHLVGVNIFSKPKNSAAHKVYKSLPKPKFYLVQLGREAKMKTLTTLELLRRERIAVYHVLGKDKLTAQLSHAESLSVPYLLLIGQREALENTVTVRNMNTRAQDTVPLEHLARFLKNVAL